MTGFSKILIRVELNGSELNPPKSIMRFSNHKEEEFLGLNTILKVTKIC